MNAIFSADSPAMRALDRFADVVVLNLLFVVTSLPLPLLGASLTALNETALKLVTGRCDSVPRTYLASYRANLRQGTALGFAAAGLLAVLGAWYLVIDHLAVSSLVRMLLLAGLVVLAYRVVGTVLFVFPYHSTFTDRTGRVLDVSRRMSARHAGTTLLVLITTVLPVLVTVFYPQVVVWGLLWVAFGFAGVAVINASVFARVFSRYGLAVATS